MKGILKIKKKPRHVLFEGKQLPISKELPEIGKEFDGLECEFEGTPINKIIVNSSTFVIDSDKKLQMEQRKQETALEETFKEEYAKMLLEQGRNGDSFRLEVSKIPFDTKNSLIKDIDNFHLKLNKFARFEGDKFYFFQKSRNGSYRIKENFGVLENKFAALNERHHNNAKALFGENVIDVTLTPSYHLVVGLGGHSVYETSMTLHHIYGVPYIPASSIKGVVRSWIILNVYENEENLALKDDTFIKWFGNQSSSGKLVFFDSFPNEKPRLEPDIMNVHYPKYYQGVEPPTDTQSPNPIPFLTVTKSPFKFFIGSSDLNSKSDKLKGQTIEWWLKDALTNHGIGAKTAVGYGYFH